MAAVAAIVQRKSLLIIDDADSRDRLAELLSELAEGRPQARILLLARDAGGWCDQVALAGPVAYALLTAARSALIELSDEPAGELTASKVAGLAGIAFAAELALPSRRIELADSQELGRFLMLDLHLAALVGVLRESPGPVSPDSAAAELLELEQGVWSKRAAQAGLTAEPGLLRQLVAAGCLLGVSTEAQAGAAADRVTEAPERATLARWLYGVLGPDQAPAGGQAATWPEPLMRQHVAAELSAAEFARRCLTGLDATQLRRVVPLIAGEGASGGNAGTRACQPPRLPEPALRLVASQLQQLNAPNSVLIGILDSLPYPDEIWADAGAAICGRIVRQLAPDADQGTRAYWLNSLSARFWLADRQSEAVAAAEEAVSIRRELASAAPDRYLAGLAVSLSYLSIQYAGMSRAPDALKVTEEAIGVRRRLAADDPDRFALPDQ
jgi:hypothetical protein